MVEEKTLGTSDMPANQLHAWTQYRRLMCSLSLRPSKYSRESSCASSRTAHNQTIVPSRRPRNSTWSPTVSLLPSGNMMVHHAWFMLGDDPHAAGTQPPRLRRRTMAACGDLPAR